MIEDRNYVQEYIDAIESGEIIVSRKIKRVYLDWMKPILADENPKWYFNPKPGLKYIAFVETLCRQSKGEWAGKLLELMLFQKAKWQLIFGVRNRETKKRRFKEVFTVEGRKNGKSTEHAPLLLWMQLIERGAEVYAAATVTSQAQRLVEEAFNMIYQEPDLQALYTIRKSPPYTIFQKGGTSYARTLSSNVSTFDGLNVSCAVIDEVHELKRQIYDILKQATSVREDSLISMITTSGFVRQGLFDDLYQHANNVLEGISEDETFLPLIYELDDEKELKDKRMWIKANPSLGVIKRIDYLEEQVIKTHSDRSYLNTVKTKDFNMIGVENKAWLSFDEIFTTEEIEVVERGKTIKKKIPLVYSEDELKKLDGTWVLGGMDLSRTGDMSSFTTLLFDREGMKSDKKPRPIAITMYWITHKFYKEQMENKRNKIPWDAWVERGLVRISGTETIRYQDISNYVLENYTERQWMYRYIHYDSYSATYLIEDLASKGYQPGGCLIATFQGYKTLSVPMQLFAAHLKEDIICYQDNPVTKWCLTNVQLETDRNGNWMPKKLNDQRERKIDGAATILNAYVGLSQNVQEYLGREI